MDSDKFDNIYKLLTEHSFDISETVPDKLKCVKCRKILINPHQTRCGCRFCRNCIDEMMMNGYQVCPGITDDCKMGLLSNTSLDFRANNRISKLILKCPEEMCSQECQLISMEEHLRMCGKKSVKCPFYNIGCDEKKITSEMMNSHFQLENYNHSKILIEKIDNIKNEIVGLKEKENINNQEIEKMKENLNLKDERIKSINAEIELIKDEKIKLENRVKTLEEIVDNKIGEYDLKYMRKFELLINEEKAIKMDKEELEQQMQISLMNIYNKIYEIDLEMNKISNNKIEFINEDIKLIQMEKNQLIEKIEIFQKLFDNKIGEIEAKNRKEIKSINNEINLTKMAKKELEKKMGISFGDLKRKIGKIIVDEQTMEIKRNAMKIDPIINHLGKFVDNKKDVMFEWTIDNVNERRNDWIYNERISSEYFYVRMQPYKLQLRMCPNGLDDFTHIGFSIWFNIYDDVVNKWLKWPFIADVTMKIINKSNPDACKDITKYCEIKKPSSNNHISSDDFHYSYSDLTKDGILESNCFIVQCCVELK